MSLMLSMRPKRSSQRGLEVRIVRLPSQDFSDSFGDIRGLSEGSALILALACLVVGA